MRCTEKLTCLRLWRQKNRDADPVMTFPNQKRIKTELVIEQRAALYIQKGSWKSKDESEQGKIVGAKEQH